MSCGRRKISRVVEFWFLFRGFIRGVEVIVLGGVGGLGELDL